jgi:hypothetical protein
MRIAGITVGTALVVCLMHPSLDAAPKGKGPAAPVQVTSAKAPKTAVKPAKAPKVTTNTRADNAKTRAPKPTTTKLETSAAKQSGTRSTVTSSTAPTTTTTTEIDFTEGKVGERLARNTKLAEKLANQLSGLGYTGDVYQAGYGFKNLGQFVAAVNNAQNHDLSFEQLKTLMTGVSVDAEGVVRYANRNPDGTVTMVPLEQLTDPAPTKSLGQAKRIVEDTVDESTTTTTATGTY